MNPNQFEDFVLKQKDLNLLINEHKFGVLSAIKHTDEMTPAFIDWISPKYYEAFIKIYKTHYKEKRGVIFSLFHTSFLANKATCEKISEILLPHIELIAEQTNKFHELISINVKNCYNGAASLFLPYERLSAAILNTFETQTLAPKRAEYISTLIDIAQLLIKASPRKSDTEFIIFRQVISELSKFNLTDEQAHKVEQLDLKVKGKAVWIYVSLIIIFISIFSTCKSQIFG